MSVSKTELLKEIIIDGNGVVSFSWDKVIKKLPEFEYLFNITIPTAKQREEVLGHLVLNIGNNIIKEAFIEELKNTYNEISHDTQMVINKSTRCSEIGSVLSCLTPGDFIYFKVRGDIKQEVQELLSQALSEYGINYEIGKGSSKRNVYIDLPPFTAVLVVDSGVKVPKIIMDSTHFFIESKLTEDESRLIEICHSASKNGLKLTEETLVFLEEKLKGKHINTHIRLLSDYLFLNHENNQPINVESIRKILRLD